MKFAYILEDDPQTRKELFESLQHIDPSIQTRFFDSLKELYAWAHKAMTKGPLALPLGGHKFSEDQKLELSPNSEDELRLVVVKNEFVGPFSKELLAKALDFLIRKNICTRDHPTAMVVTAYDHADFDLQQAKEKNITNVIFKPFDKLILQQHLEFALIGRQPLTPQSVAPLEVNVTIDVINDLNFQKVSEVGFSFLSSIQLGRGTRSRFYHEIFETHGFKSVIGYCRSSTKINPKEYLCEFEFLGLPQEQISKVRRAIFQTESHTKKFFNKASPNPFRILILDEDLANNLQLKALLEDSIENLEAHSYSSLGQLLSDLKDHKTPNRKELPLAFDLVLADFGFFEIEKEERWNKILLHLNDRGVRHNSKTAKSPELYLYSKKKISSKEVLGLGPWVRDVFFAPLDLSYVLKKWTFLYPSLACKEELSLGWMGIEGVLKVAHPAQALEVSEAGLVMRYDFALDIGAFRRFSLWRADSIPYSEILGVVNFAEENEHGFFHHFVFFGIRDEHLKNIRIWIRENYIKAKESASLYIE